MRTFLVLLLALTALVALPPSAAACTYAPVASVGTPAPPSPGVYTHEGCHGYGEDRSLVLHVGQTVLGCTYVPPAYVAHQQVPHTGTSHCAHGMAVPTGVDIPDEGVTVCLDVCVPLYLQYTLLLCNHGFLDHDLVVAETGCTVV